MYLYQCEIYHNTNGDRGEIVKVSNGFSVRKYHDFCIMYYSKRFASYGQAKKHITDDGFRKER